MSWSWLDLVLVMFLVILLGGAMANVSDGPMHQYRGSWVTRASR